MISREELEAWSQLYDRGYNSFEVDEKTFAARAELDQVLADAYPRLVPGGSISFRDFRREAITRMRELLRKQFRPPTT
ncbi:MAG TPA: hypothetical protein VE860_18840 [Chthoniobacterales bacterium]|jgi:hypothetical protein|nr:hypothetical protein [Chthoniobacterales bacterium]